MIGMAFDRLCFFSMNGARKLSVHVGVGVLLIHTAAFAQHAGRVSTSWATQASAGLALLSQDPEPAPAPAPAPPAPVPAPPVPPPPTPAPYPYPYPYGPPPQYRPPTPYYYPPPPTARGVYRSFTIALGLGSGWLSFPRDNEHQSGLTYLARVGFGVTRDWIVFLGLDGATVGTPELTQTNYLLGAQYFFARRIYGRGGVGLATVTEETTYSDAGGASGQAFQAGLGAELVQGDSVALGVEWSSAIARFPGGNYFQNGLCLALVFY
jgi:hypothetical protein